ncbi:hypothetical protein D3C76_352740 [compost metagenome]
MKQDYSYVQKKQNGCTVLGWTVQPIFLGPGGKLQVEKVNFNLPPQPYLSLRLRDKNRTNSPRRVIKTRPFEACKIPPIWCTKCTYCCTTCKIFAHLAWFGHPWLNVRILPDSLCGHYGVPSRSISEACGQEIRYCGRSSHTAGQTD